MYKREEKESIKENADLKKSQLFYFSAF
jgi:hypothetical protein